MAYVHRWTEFIFISWCASSYDPNDVNISPFTLQYVISKLFSRLSNCRSLGYHLPNTFLTLFDTFCKCSHLTSPISGYDDNTIRIGHNNITRAYSDLIDTDRLVDTTYLNSVFACLYLAACCENRIVITEGVIDIMVYTGNNGARKTL